MFLHFRTYLLAPVVSFSVPSKTQKLQGQAHPRPNRSLAAADHSRWPLAGGKPAAGESVQEERLKRDGEGGHKVSFESIRV